MSILIRSLLDPQQIFSDTLSRPITTKLNCLSAPKNLFTASLLRLAFCVPAFFLYIAGGERGDGLIPSNDAIFAVSIGVFSFTSGYLVTAASQAAPYSVPYRYRTTVANLCTIAFQSAFAAALLLALVLRTLLFPSM